ncbi:MAG: hypothetical protein LBN30_08730 [Oscillospiraceae bacterium]|jgi:hypothetical protein|nr:hypothetical protein [Oscillospiraceae bacterium]
MAEKIKRRWKDRKDGRYIRTLDPYHKFPPFVMKTKNDACNNFRDSIEVTEIEQYIRKKRAEGFPGLGMLHLFTAAYIRVASRYPAINRFVSGQRVYARRNIELVMTIKSALTLDAPETSIKVVFDFTDTIDDVYRKINAEVEKVKSTEATSTDDVAAILCKIPRVPLKFVMWLINLLDYFGKLPGIIMEASPFHGSLIITDLGSIGLPAIYHHLYNFGNLPLFCSLGAKRRVYEVRQDGSVAECKYLDYTIVMDERVCDGFHFSQIYRYLNSIFRNPAMLDVPPSEIVPDVE